MSRDSDAHDLTALAISPQDGGFVSSREAPPREVAAEKVAACEVLGSRFAVLDSGFSIFGGVSKL
jgi:hypothetical protein